MQHQSDSLAKEFLFSCTEFPCQQHFLMYKKMEQTVFTFDVGPAVIVGSNDNNRTDNEISNDPEGDDILSIPSTPRTPRTPGTANSTIKRGFNLRPPPSPLSLASSTATLTSGMDVECGHCHNKSPLFNHHQASSPSSLAWSHRKSIKCAILSLIVIFALSSFILYPEKREEWFNVAPVDATPVYVNITHDLDFIDPAWIIRARAEFLPHPYANLSSKLVTFNIIRLDKQEVTGENKDDKEVIVTRTKLFANGWTVAIPDASIQQKQQTFPRIELSHRFIVSNPVLTSLSGEQEVVQEPYDSEAMYQLEISTNNEEAFAISLYVSATSDVSLKGVIMAGCVLLFLYSLIIFDVVHRTLAAMIGATAAIACLTIIHERPPLEKVASWLDIETLTLLFGMMIMVAILCDTGFFDYVAVLAFKLAKGQIWPLVVILCLFTGVLSAFLDNVTTILLMTPVTIKLCEIKNIDPKHVLIAQVLFSNIGGAATPVGDPPNVIIINSWAAKSLNIGFSVFTYHVAPGIIFCFLVAMVIIRFMFRNGSKFDFEQPPDAIVGKGMVMNFLREEVEDMERGLAEEAAAAASNLAMIQSESGVSGMKGTATTSHLNKCKTKTDETKPLLTHSWNKTYAATGGNDSQFSQTKTTNKPSNLNILTSIQCLQSPTDLHTDLLSPVSPLKQPKKPVTDEPSHPPVPAADIKQELDVWKKAHNSVGGRSPDDKSVRRVLRKKVAVLESRLRKKLRDEKAAEGDTNRDNFREHLAELERRYRIKNKPLLIKSGVVMTIVIILFFLQGLPSVDLSLGWIAILGAVALLILADFEDLDSVIGRIEWSTLLFFAALFVVMEALTELKLLYWVGQMTQQAINSFHEDYRLFAAVNVILWVSAIASSFIDNIPFATVMVKILEDMARSPNINLPLAPLVYALAFGACLGGNGTLIGASANVVCAGVAEQHGYKISFVDFFKIGFPVMLVTVGVANIYLVVCHVAFSWQ